MHCHFKNRIYNLLLKSKLYSIYSIFIKLHNGIAYYNNNGIIPQHVMKHWFPWKIPQLPYSVRLPELQNSLAFFYTFVQLNFLRSVRISLQQFLRFKKKTIFNSAPLCITNFINQFFGPLKSVVGINSRMVNFSAILDLLFLQKTWTHFSLLHLV